MRSVLLSVVAFFSACSGLDDTAVTMRTGYVQFEGERYVFVYQFHKNDNAHGHSPLLLFQFGKNESYPHVKFEDGKYSVLSPAGNMELSFESDKVVLFDSIDGTFEVVGQAWDFVEFQKTEIENELVDISIFMDSVK